MPSCCRAVFLRICKSLSFNELHIKCDKLGTYRKRGKQYNCDKLGDFWKRELKVIRTQIWNIRSKNETNMRSMRVISLKNKLGLLRQKMNIENYSRKKRKGQVRQIRNIFARTVQPFAQRHSIDFKTKEDILRQIGSFVLTSRGVLSDKMEDAERTQEDNGDKLGTFFIVPVPARLHTLLSSSILPVPPFSFNIWRSQFFDLLMQHHQRDLEHTKLGCKSHIYRFHSYPFAM